MTMTSTTVSTVQAANTVSLKQLCNLKTQIHYLLGLSVMQENDKKAMRGCIFQAEANDLFTKFLRISLLIMFCMYSFVLLRAFFGNILSNALPNAITGIIDFQGASGWTYQLSQVFPGQAFWGHNVMAMSAFAMIYFQKLWVTPKYMNLRLHRIVGIILCVAAFVICITGVWMANFMVEPYGSLLVMSGSAQTIAGLIVSIIAVQAARQRDILRHRFWANSAMHIWLADPIGLSVSKIILLFTHDYPGLIVYSGSVIGGSYFMIMFFYEGLRVRQLIHAKAHP